MRHEIISLIRDRCPSDGGEGGLTTFLNPYSYLIARKDPQLFKNFDAVHVDGIMLCLALRAISIERKRASFDMTSLAPVVMQEAAQLGRTVYLVGGRKCVAERAAKAFVARFPSLKMLGARDGYFSSTAEMEFFVAGLAELGPDIVIAGMGTPFQERFLVALRAAGWMGDGYTCGGFFHQTSSRGLAYYPRWADALHLRWLFRMFDEPRLIRRYAFDYGKFMLLFSVDALSFVADRFRSRHR